MKQNSVIIASLAFLSLVAGYLLSGISLVGKAGISIIYTQYRFLKTWWKGALLVFIVWLVFFLVQSLIKQRAGRATSNMIQAVLLIVAIACLLFSYSDFNNTLSHRWLGTSFHLGVYLFFLGWMGICVFLLAKKKPLVLNVPET